MFIQPQWPAPSQIVAYTTTRLGGVSLPPYDHFNLADHVGDDEQKVNENRAILKKTLKLPAEPIWIKQTHSTIAISADEKHRYQEADASFTHQRNNICVVLTADCLPLLVCDKNGKYVAAIHAGWKGLAYGVIEATLEKIPRPAKDLLVWLGPAIGPNFFEVGDDVRNIFLQKDPAAEQAFRSLANGKWLGNLYSLAKMRLEKKGVHSIYGGEYCTYSDEKRFYSYRRDGANTGRIASLIYIGVMPACL